MTNSDWFRANIQVNKGNAKRGISPRLKIWPGDLDLWPWKSIGFQILLWTKYVPSLIKIHWRMLILECSQGCYRRTEGRTDGSITISLHNFVGEGIIILPSSKSQTSIIVVHSTQIILQEKVLKFQNQCWSKKEIKKFFKQMPLK